jgi:hypothetical protein
VSNCESHHVLVGSECFCIWSHYLSISIDKIAQDFPFFRSFSATFLLALIYFTWKSRWHPPLIPLFRLMHYILHRFIHVLASLNQCSTACLSILWCGISAHSSPPCVSHFKCTHIAPLSQAFPPWQMRHFEVMCASWCRCRCARKWNDGRKSQLFKRECLAFR